MFLIVTAMGTVVKNKTLLIFFKRLFNQLIVQISVLLFIAVLSIFAGSTAAALADIDGGRHRGRLQDSWQDETSEFTDSAPRVCQAPPADDMSVLMESAAGVGPVRTK